MNSNELMISSESKSTITKDKLVNAAQWVGSFCITGAVMGTIIAINPSLVVSTIICDGIAIGARSMLKKIVTHKK